MFSSPEPQNPRPPLNLTSPRVVSQVLEEHGLRLQKSFGQHFLIDNNVRQKIIKAAELTKTDVAIEVGPGIGTLSQEIAPQVKKLWLVELDKKLVPILEETLANYNNCEIIQADALRLDYSKIEPQPYKMVSNLPYNISASLILNLLTQTVIQEYVLMIQDEMARRLTAQPGSKDYGALSVKMAYLCEARILFKVSEQVFFPKPKVQSAVIKLKKSGNKTDKALFKAIEGSFAYRRKSIKRALILSGYEQEAVVAALSESDIKIQVRAEDLGLKDFQKLACALDDH